MYNPLDLSGKTILVTGASSGIGRSICIVLSKLGARILMTGRDPERLAATLAEMDPAPGHVVSAHEFTNDDAATVAWLKELCAANGPLDGMVHSAGISQTVPLKVINRAHMDATFHPNVYVALALLKAATSKKVLADDTAIVLLSSTVSVSGVIGLSTYAASKGALNSMARSASLELGARKIRVNCLAPALTKTPMVSSAREQLPGDLARTEQRQFLGLLEPEEVAVAAAFLLSGSGKHITGTTLVMDGGYSC